MSRHSQDRNELLHKLGENNAEYIAGVCNSADPQLPKMTELRKTRFDLIVRLLEVERGSGPAGSE